MTTHRNGAPARPALLLSIALLLAAATAAFAHLKVQSTSPEDGAVLKAAPATLEVQFTQVPDRAISRLRLEGPGGAVDLGGTEEAGEKGLRAEIQGPMGRGEYRAIWRSAGDDGHVHEGWWTFEVGVAAR